MLDDKNLKIELVWDSDQTVWMQKSKKLLVLNLRRNQSMA